VVVLAFTPERETLAALALQGAERIYWCERAEEYEGELWVAAAEQVARETAPVAILAGHTPAGAELAPRLAFRLASAVATGCTGVGSESGKLLFTRGCFGGNVRETLSFSCAPAVATIRPGVGEAVAQHDRVAEVVRIDVPAFATRVRVLARERESADSKRLEDARIVVAGGRGLEEAEGFRVIEELAAVLGGAVGASRVPCDLGWCPHSWQIGLTGKTITPDLYIAVGISGAGQHMAGCGNARTIVAINTDPEAAIFRDARFGLVGDYRKLVPALTAAVAALKADPAATTA
jgi:electron transfer flavoprotein alpha subunit